MDYQIDAMLRQSLSAVEAAMETQGHYMPAFATYLRLIADEMADKYPDEINGGN